MNSRLLLTALTIFSITTGCRPVDPLDLRVEADSPLAFNMWRSRVGTSLAREQWREFDAAIQEIRFRVTATYEETGTIGVDEAMRAKVDGCTIRQVLELGYQARLARLQGDREQIEHFLAVNATIRTRPDDTASIQYLENVCSRQEADLKPINREIREAQQQLRALHALAVHENH